MTWKDTLHSKRLQSMSPAKYIHKRDGLASSVSGYGLLMGQRCHFNARDTKHLINLTLFVTCLWPVNKAMCIYSFLDNEFKIGILFGQRVTHFALYFLVDAPVPLQVKFHSLSHCSKKPTSLFLHRGENYPLTGYPGKHGQLYHSPEYTDLNKPDLFIQSALSPKVGWASGSDPCSKNVLLL